MEGTIRHFVRLQDLTERELEEVLELSSQLRGHTSTGLTGRTVGLLFFRGSLRTRTSLEVALQQLGGHSVHLAASSDFWELEAREGVVMDGAAPEHIRDAAATMSRYVDALAIRPKPAGRSWEIDRRDEGIRAWATHAQVPVINMESALWHPLQALADLMTLRGALGPLEGKKLAIRWTPSPAPASPAVIHSMLFAALRSGMNVSIAHPHGYSLDGGVLSEAHALASERNVRLEDHEEPNDGLKGAHVVYARSWQSLDAYGNPTLEASRAARGSDWIVDERAMSLGDNAFLMHPMPVRRNLEVTDEVIDGPRSLVYSQAENRLHTQKGLLSQLLGS